MASNEPEHAREEEETVAGAEDEDTGAPVAPIVRLEEVTVTTGEEDEDVILDLYIFPFFSYFFFILLFWSAAILGFMMVFPF